MIMQANKERHSTRRRSAAACDSAGGVPRGNAM